MLFLGDGVGKFGYISWEIHERGKKPPEHDSEYEGERYVNTLVGVGGYVSFFVAFKAKSVSQKGKRKPLILVGSSQMVFS